MERKHSLINYPTEYIEFKWGKIASATGLSFTEVNNRFIFYLMFVINHKKERLRLNKHELFVINETFY